MWETKANDVLFSSPCAFYSARQIEQGPRLAEGFAVLDACRDFPTIRAFELAALGQQGQACMAFLFSPAKSRVRDAAKGRGRPWTSRYLPYLPIPFRTWRLSSDF